MGTAPWNKVCAAGTGNRRKNVQTKTDQVLSRKHKTGFRRLRRTTSGEDVVPSEGCQIANRNRWVPHLGTRCVPQALETAGRMFKQEPSVFCHERTRQVSGGCAAHLLAKMWYPVTDAKSKIANRDPSHRSMPACRLNPINVKCPSRKSLPVPALISPLSPQT